MSDSKRLDRGFVNWQGQRIFVPWFGAPRIVPSAADETRILKLRFLMDYVPVALLVLLLGLAIWVDGFEAMAVAWILMALGLCLFVHAAFLEQRWIRHWPRQSTALLSRARFLLSYYRNMSTGDRLWELVFGVGGVALAGRAIHDDFIAVTHPWPNWQSMILSLLLIGLFTFLMARYATVALLSLFPVPRTQLN